MRYNFDDYEVTLTAKRFSYLNDKELEALENVARSICGQGILQGNPVLTSALYKLGIILSPYTFCDELRLFCQNILEKKDGIVKKRLGKKVAIVDGWGSSTSIGLYLFYDDLDFYADLEWPSDWEQWVTIDFVKSQGFEIVIA